MVTELIYTINGDFYIESLDNQNVKDILETL